MHIINPYDFTAEINYLNNHIKNCEIYKANKSEISFITKK